MLGVRLFDAVNDPIIGSMADRTRTRWGRYRPWLLFGGIGLPLSMIALFGAHSSWNPTAKVLWMCIWYVVVTVMSTCYDMPYSALHGALSPSSRERVRISSVRLTCSQIGTQITGILGIQLILYFSHAGGARTEGGYLTAVALICLATLPLAIWPAFKSRERVQPPPDQKKIPVRGQLLTLLKNPPIIIISVVMMTLWFHWIRPQQYDDVLLHLRAGQSQGNVAVRPGLHGGLPSGKHLDHAGSVPRPSQQGATPPLRAICSAGFPAFWYTWLPPAVWHSGF